MISGKRLAPRRLGAYFSQLPATQIGIGSYEAVGGGRSLGDEQVTTAAFAPQVVAAPESSGDAQEVARRGAKSALAVLVLFGAFTAASYGGYRATRSLLQKAR